MRRILSIAIALVSVLVLAQSAFGYSEGAYSWGYDKWYGCTKTGGTYGQGYVGAVAVIQVTAATTTNHMEIWYSRQYKGIDAKWHNDRSWKDKSGAFADRTAIRFTSAHVFPFNNDLGTYRLVVKYRWYDYHWYGDSLIKSKVLYGNACTPT